MTHVSKCYLTGRDCLCYCQCCAGMCGQEQSHPVSKNHNVPNVRCQSGTRMEVHKIGKEQEP